MPSTDTIKLKATFDNADRSLWPGEFSRVTLHLATLPQALVVPSEAVQTGQDGQYVFVVKSDSTVEQRPVATGQRMNEDDRRREGPEARRDDRHGRAIAARTGNGGPDRARRGRGRRAGAAVAGGRRRSGHAAVQGVEGRAARPLEPTDPAWHPSLAISRSAREPLRNLHPTSDRHQPADGRDRAVWRGGVPRAADQRSAAGGLPDDQRPGQPAWRRSGDDGVVGREPAGAAVHDHRRRRFDGVARAAPAAARSRCSSIWIATSTARRWTCRRRSRRRCRCCRRR